MAKKAEVKKDTPAVKSFIKRGQEGLAEIKKNEKLAQVHKEKFALDFFMKEGETARIIFLDESADDFAYVYRHTLKTGRGIQKLTCIKDYDPPCPICVAKGKDSFPSLVAHATILDLRPYTAQKGPNAGKVVKYTRKLYPIKGKSMQLRIAELSKKYGGLRGLVFDVKRYTAQDASSGSVIDRATNEKGKDIPKIDLAAKFPKDDIVVFDYEKVLAKPTPEEYNEAGIPALGGASAAEAVGSVVVADAEIDDIFKV